MEGHRLQIWAWILAAVVISSAAILRFSGMNWDEGHHLHPDERFLSMVIAKYRSNADWRDYWDNEQSGLNPQNVGHSFFVYGTWPTHLTYWISRWTYGEADYHSNLKVGRALSATADLLIAIVILWIGATLGLSLMTRSLAAFVYGCMPLPIQLSHFMAVDPFAALFGTLCFVPALKALEARSIPLTHALWFGIFFGLSLSAKLSGIPLALLWVMVAATRIYRSQLSKQGLAPALQELAVGGFAGVVSFLVFRLCQPYAFASRSWLELNANWLEGLKQVHKSALNLGFPPDLQWIEQPWYFAAKNLALWGASPAATVAALGGLAYLVARYKSSAKGWWPLVVLFFVTLVWQSSKINPMLRYLYPYYGVVALLAALATTAPQSFKTKAWAKSILALGMLLVAMGFTSIYRKPMTRIEASDWIYRQVPAGLNLVVKTETGRVQLVPLPVLTSSGRVLKPGEHQLIPDPVINEKVWICGLMAPRLKLITPTVSPPTPQKNKNLSGQLTAILDTEKVELPFVFTRADKSAPQGDYEVWWSSVTPRALPAGRRAIAISLDADAPEVELKGLRFTLETRWDDVLPLHLRRVQPFPHFYEENPIEVYLPDQPEKVAQVEKAFAESHVFVASSNRQWGSIGRVPGIYPWMSQFYSDLLGCNGPVTQCYAGAQAGSYEGRLGWSLVHVQESYPGIGSVSIPDQLAEESFTVYDHPKVMVFTKDAVWGPIQRAMESLDATCKVPTESLGVGQ